MTLPARATPAHLEFAELWLRLRDIVGPSKAARMIAPRSLAWAEGVARVANGHSPDYRKFKHPLDTPRAGPTPEDLARIRAAIDGVIARLSGAAENSTSAS